MHQNVAPNVTNQRRQSASSHPSCTTGREVDFTPPENIPAFLALVANMYPQKRLDTKTGHAVCDCADTPLRAYEMGVEKNQMNQVERLPTRRLASLQQLDFRANLLEEIGDLREIAAKLSGQAYAQRRVRVKRCVQSALKFLPSDPAYWLGCGRTRAQDSEKQK
jgi:hypothetical protein